MRDKLATLPVWVFLLCCTPFFAVCAGLSAVVDRSGRLWWPISQWWSRGIYRLAGVRSLRVVGDERLYDGSPWVLMANHQSHLDVACLIDGMQRPISFLTKVELFSIPFFGWSLRRMGHVAIDRKDRDRAFQALAEAGRTVAEGRMVLVFPEGTRSVDGQLQPFKKGGFVMATESGVPIVPIGIAGTREVLPPGYWAVGRSPAVICVGEPIVTSGRDKDQVMDEVRTAITRLRDAAEAERQLSVSR